MTEPLSERDAALRQAFVSLATADRFEAPKRARKRSLIAVVAFLVGGLLAGGAVSGAAFAVNAQSTAQSAVEGAAKGFVGTHGRLLGSPVAYRGTERIDLSLGSAPSSADQIVIGFACDQGGKYVIQLNGLATSAGTETCPSQTSGSTGTFAFEIPASGAGRHDISVVSHGRGYSLWASWVKEPPIPRPTADQNNAVADGIVTRAEYLAAWNGYLGCMAGKGFPLTNIPQTSNQIGGGIPDAAYNADRICYPLEYKEVDNEWAAEHAAEQQANPNWANDTYEGSN